MRCLQTAEYAPCCGDHLSTTWYSPCRTPSKIHWEPSNPNCRSSVGIDQNEKASSSRKTTSTSAFSTTTFLSKMSLPVSDGTLPTNPVWVSTLRATIEP